MLDDQTFLVKKNFVEKFLSQKDSGSKIVFCLEKLDRVNPRGGYMTPQKIVGFKFCWVIVSCPKRFFVKKRNIGRVNWWGEGLMAPPPEKSRVKNCVGLLIVLLGEAV